MGNVFERQHENYLSEIPPQEKWLQNQTFRIQNQVYTLLDRKGGGSFGSVWSSTTPHGQYAAVKVFDFRHQTTDVYAKRLVRSFKDEINMAWAMRDARNHVVTLYGYDFDPMRGVALVAMELGNDSLHDRVQNLHQIYGKPGIFASDYISPEERKDIWIQLMKIIMALHQYRIVHRDLKPANLVFFGPRLKVVDLGIAQQELLSYFDRPRSVGTPYYSAPECFTGYDRVTAKADIWSTGAILYYMTYGMFPADLSSKAPPGVRKTHSKLVQQILYHCLQYDPRQRPKLRWLVRHPLTSKPATE